MKGKEKKRTEKTKDEKERKEREKHKKAWFGPLQKTQSMFALL